ncbi:MAG: 4Fe-4S dicluster domain-containing protein [Sulfolobales archaeon]|nr:4Fe-4S binding protein [Sulfolobales archaeon]MCX8209183.1 4Fe-4S binding protein [Sulfolobales archaeon]MDW8010043.1 4Fe-4S dicluster domain-containing protein [Sulfolobales archaeon]
MPDPGVLMRVIDYSKCMGCGTCEAVCGFIHELGPFIRLYELGGGVARPISCFHCSRAPCVEACPTGAMRRDSSGAVYVELSRCIGCMACLYACPFGIPDYGEAVKASVKCDLCRSLRGDGLVPACVAMCPSRAILVGMPKAVGDEVKRRALARIVQLGEFK